MGACFVRSHQAAEFRDVGVQNCGQAPVWLNGIVHFVRHGCFETQSVFGSPDFDLPTE